MSSGIVSMQRWTLAACTDSKRAVACARVAPADAFVESRKRACLASKTAHKRGGWQAFRAAGKDDRILEGNRAVQVGGSKLLMKLLEADDTRAAARDIAADMDEGFFSVGAAYLDMAKKEKQLEVAARIESALKIAMEEKNNTLRPEIKLLNRLIAEPKSFKRKQVLNTREAGEALQMNDGYFFTLLTRMTADVENQPSNPQKKPLLSQLQDIKLEASARLPPSPRGFGKP